MRAILIFVSFFTVSAFAKSNRKVTLTVSLSAQSVSLVKQTATGPMELRGEILPVNSASFHTSVFRPQSLRERFQSQDGNVMLENVILFDGNRTLRSSRMFHYLKAEGLKVSGSIVLEPELGSIVFDTIRTYGLKNTTIVIKN